jgi:hypothetical protein
VARTSSGVSEENFVSTFGRDLYDIVPEWCAVNFTHVASAVFSYRSQEIR